MQQPFGKYHRLSLALAACLWLLPAGAGAQPWAEVVTDSVRHLFERPRKVKVRHYHALLDDCYELSVTLGFSQDRVRGYATYLSSGDRLRLEGAQRGDTLVLYEAHGPGQRAAAWRLLPKGEKGQALEGEWLRYDGTTAFPLVLSPTPRPPDIPRHCGAGKWIAHYEGWQGNTWLGLWLHRTAEGRLYGSGLWGATPLVLKGHIAGDSARIDCFDEQGHRLATIDARTGEPRQWFAHIQTSYGARATWTLARTALLPTDCYAWAGYMGSYDFFFPKTQYPPFNEWVESRVRRWMTSCRTELARYRAEHRPAPPRRAALRATGWWELAWADTRYLSGRACLAASWQPQTDCQAFIFDLEAGRPVAPWQEFFRPGSRAEVLALLRQCVARHALTAEEGFTDWLDAALGQVQLGLHPAGLTFYLPPHPLFGHVQCTLTADELAPWLQPQALTHLKNERHGHQ